MKVAATYSIKGGVGKTTTAVNLAAEAARSGSRVLVWDLDPQGSATYLLRVRPKLRGGTKSLVASRRDLGTHLRASAIPAVDVLPADFSLRHLDLHLERTKDPSGRLGRLLSSLEGSYDLVLIDCAPSISLASESVFRAADALLVPVVPATLSSRTMRQLARFLADDPAPPDLLPFLSMVDRRRKLHRELTEALTRDWPALLPTAVPSSAVVERMGVERAPVAAYAPRSAAARSYRDLWNDVAGALWSS